MNITEIKKDMYESVKIGQLDSELVEKFLLTDGSVVPKECEIWDYKLEFTGDPQAYLKTLKSIASLYNSYGGYIVYGVSELVTDTKFELVGISDLGGIDLQKIRTQFDNHFGRRIDITYLIIPITNQGKSFNIGVMHVPMRPVEQHTVSVIKEGKASNNKIILAKHGTYFRIGDECKLAKQQADFEFLSNPRDYIATLVGGSRYRKKIIDHNLPDKNFICPKFIGRTDVIQDLWAWFGDEFQYAKVLAGGGGKGKTSIAYEFAQLIVKSGNPLIEQVIWLSAKQQQFKPSHNEYVDTPETHYWNQNSLLKAICIRTASLEVELDDVSDSELKRITQRNLAEFPSLIIIDDVDSNDPDEQRRIMEAARYIANKDSRILLTTRVNNIFSSDYCTVVPGLDGKEYDELVETLCNKFGLQQLNQQNLTKLRGTSEGSPLFTESILHSNSD